MPDTEKRSWSRWMNHFDAFKQYSFFRNSQSDNEMKRKRPRRPPQKLFDMDAIRGIGGDVTQDGDFLIFESNRYTRKGFLYKQFAMSAIMADGVKPTLSELEKFEEQSLADMEVRGCVRYGLEWPRFPCVEGRAAHAVFRRVS